MNGTNSNNTQASFPPSNTTTKAVKIKVKQLLQEFGEHTGHGELHALNVVHDRRNESACGVFLIKRPMTAGEWSYITRCADR